MNSISIDDILSGIKALKALDPTYLLFGASAHRYEFNPPLSEEALKGIECQYQIALPPDYRAFLREIGNGGAGPGYGMCGWGQADTGNGMEPWDRQDPSREFPHANSWSGSGYFDEPIPENYEGDEATFKIHHQQWKERNSDWREAYIDGAGIYYGTVPLCHYGCGQTGFLIVNGASYGEVWLNMLSDDEGVKPEMHDGKRLSFGDWYMKWLQESLRELQGH